MAATPKPDCLQWDKSKFAEMADGEGNIHVSVVGHGAEVKYPGVAFAIPQQVRYQLHCQSGERLDTGIARDAWHGYAAQFATNIPDQPMRNYSDEYNSMGENYNNPNSLDYDVSLSYASWEKGDFFESGIWFHRNLTAEEGSSPDWIVADMPWAYMDYVNKGYVYMSEIIPHLQSIPGLKQYLDESGKTLVVHGVHCRVKDSTGQPFAIAKEDIGPIGPMKTLEELLKAHPLVKGQATTKSINHLDPRFFSHEENPGIIDDMSRRIEEIGNELAQLGKAMNKIKPQSDSKQSSSHHSNKHGGPGAKPVYC